MSRYKNLKNIYMILYSYYGPQGWWPVTQGNAYPTYRKNYFGPLTESECFEISCGAILTQSVSWKNVEKCIVNLKKADLISPKRIVKVSTNDLELLIRSSGYYRQKAIKLKNFSNWILLNGGKLKNIFKTDPYKIREDLLKIKGIGKETADSILLYAGCFPFFVIDAYTKRLFKRVYNTEIQEYDILQDIFHLNINKDFKIYNEFHALIVEHSKRFCGKIPICYRCPLLRLCFYGRGYGNI